MVSVTKLITQAEFDQLTFRFKTSESESSKSIDLNFTSADFRLIEGAEGSSLMKIVVNNAIQE